MNEDDPVYQSIYSGGGQTCDIIGVVRELKAAGFVIVPIDAVQDAVDYLGGYMGSISTYRKVEALRERLRSALPRTSDGQSPR